ncbi:MAG: hypothetical protein KDK76_06295, partial [Chlamydiia bacterium]|nr:hypothetical protein [Chlamydiia bacterium]
LFNKEGDAKVKVTDTGLLMEVPAAGEKHSVGCSPHYAPSFIWEDISHQRIELQGKLFSMGHQSKAGDVFSFGVTIQKDILDKLINEIGSGHGVKIDNEYERIEGPFTQEALVQHEKSAPGQRVIYIPRKGQKEEALLKSPLLEGVRQRTLEALDKLQPHLSEKEIGTLKALAKLSHSLQKEKEEDVPPIEAVLEELTKIAQIFE